ncbi:hypothetical protein Tco_0993534 [Tanacetum coccineum]
MELRDIPLSGSDDEEANEHIEKVVKTVDMFHVPKVTQHPIMLRTFPETLVGATKRLIKSELMGAITTWAIMKSKFLAK